MQKTGHILSKLHPFLTIAHSSKGRVRLRISPKILSKKDEILGNTDLDALVSKIDGIKSVRLNKTIGTLTIHYDSDIFSDQFWIDLVEGRNLDKVSTKIDKLVSEIKDV